MLFVDLIGFTGRADKGDPEDVRDLLETYHAAAREAIESFDGNLEKFIGDAVMAVFGAPLSHGDDADRAVRAGLAVLSAVGRLGLQARAGVNTGEAVVAVGAAAESGQALAMGDVVNTASRLQSSAPTGGLIVGDETYQLTRDTITYESVPAIEARGKSEPVTVWRAIAPVAIVAERSKTSMVGRDREMALLASIWDRAVTDRHPHLVTVVGPPGIGKSRLQRELSARVRERGGAVARGRCLPYGDRAAYGAFTQLIRVAAGIYENDSNEAARPKLQATVARLLPAGEVEATNFYLSILVGLSAGEQALQRAYLFYAARRFLESLAATQPLLVIFEDLHWADGGLLDLIEYLASHAKDTPLMLVCLARPEFIDRRSSWGSGLYAHTTIGLEQLSSAEAAELTRKLLESSDQRQETIERLAETAEGNPLFIEELTSALAEGQEPASSMPTTVRAAIASRIDALPGGARAVLLDASVSGRTFWQGMLESLGIHRELDGDLAILESRDFIRRVPESKVQGEVEYQFRHFLIHDVAYTTLPRATRRQRHGAVAAYIESVAQDTTSLATILASHWREAGESTKAIHYLLVAAEQALNGWALNDAVMLYDSAIALAPTDEQRHAIQLTRGLARSRLGDYPAAVADLDDLLPHLTGRDRAEALLGHSWASEWRENTDQTLASAEEALAIAQAANDPELTAIASAMVSQGLAMRGGPGDLDSAAEIGEEALRLWVEGTRPWWRLNHVHMLGEQYYWTGKLEEATGLLDSAVADGSDPQSIQARLRSSFLRAQILCSKGRYEESLKLFDESILFARDSGRPTRIAKNYSTQPFREVFDIEEARRRAEECLEGPDEHTGFLMPRANARTDLLYAAMMAGDISTAEKYWRLQWEESSQVQAWTRWLMNCRLAAARSEMELMTGHVDRAVEWAYKTIDASVPVRRIKYEIVGRTLLGRALLAQGKAQDAVSELGTAVELADRLDSPLLRWQAREGRGRALYATGDETGAEQALATAIGIIRDVASNLAPERSARYLAAEPVRQVLARTTSPRP